MSDSLKKNYLFIGHHLTVNEVCHQRNFGLKSDRPLSTLKKQCEMVSSNNSSQIEIKFFDSKPPYEAKNSLLMTFEDI